jgi:hypothetical protein
MSNGSRFDGVIQQVPHVWYDIIGRVIPGAFLLGGVVEARRCYFATHWLRRSIRHDSIAVLTIFLFVFISFAFVVGFLLAAANPLVDYLWSRCKPFRLRQFNNATQQFLGREFGICPYSESREQNEDIGKARDAILHLLWTYPAGTPVAQLTSKRDAEKLASSSFCVAGLILFAINTWCTGQCSWQICLSVLLGLAFLIVSIAKEPEKLVGVLIVAGAIVLAVISVRSTDCIRSFFYLAVILASFFSYGHYRKRCLETPLDVIEDIRRRFDNTHGKVN